MKNILLLIAVLFTFQATNAQEAPEVQNSLISKISATWCPPCGGWGWGFFHDLEEDNNANALVIAVHHSGDLVNATASAFTNNFGTNSQPRFILNNQDQSVSSGNTATKRTAFQDAVNIASQNNPVVNTGLMAILDNNVITVKTNTKFFQDASGEYFLGVYVVENNVANYQASVGNDAIHTNILRTGLSTSAFGESLNAGAVTAGTEMDMEFTIDVNTNWNLDNVTMAAIIWKFENGQYTFINTNSTSTFEDPIVINSIYNINPASWNMKIQPTVSKGDATILVDLPAAVDAFDIVVFNQIGQAVITLHRGALTAGKHSFSVDTALPKGIYLVRSNSGRMVETKRMIVN